MRGKKGFKDTGIILDNGDKLFLEEETPDNQDGAFIINGKKVYKLEDGRLILEDGKPLSSILPTEGRDRAVFNTIQEESPPKTPKGKYKSTRYLLNQKNKYTPISKSNIIQPSLFDSLLPKTKKEIEEAVGMETKEIVEGIKLSAPETKLVDCLCKLLHNKSQNKDPKKPDYYSGNLNFEMVEYGGRQEKAPKLAFTLYELTKEYKGGEDIPGGRDIADVRSILTDLDNRRFLISYIETTLKKDGGRIERKIEDFKKIIHIVKMSEVEYNKVDIEISKKEETIILLNPIFRIQIENNYILYPEDLNKRTIIAYGSHNISDIAIRLRDYLIEQLSYKNYQIPLGVDKLYNRVAEKWLKESRKKKIKEYLVRALEMVKNLGLLLSYEYKTGATGEDLIVFNINPDWE